MSEQWPRPQRYWDAGPGPGLPGALSPPPPGNGADPLAYRSPQPAPAPYSGPPYPPSGPPARVGSAAAGLICAILTLAFPVFFFWIGLPLLGLLVNIPGIAFGCVALTKTDDPPEVERFIRYTWAGTISYLALVAAVFVGVLALVFATLSR
ncbi:MAG: hypothetical protein M0026_05335 [Nocardiopsaceae bacterium]|nr:hypothetical protein [Nocardiopsaceae bacterium]